MDKNKIKMKYHLGVWKLLPEYPNSEDLIFELNSYLIKDGRPDGEFSEQTFNSFLPFGWETDNFGPLVKELIDNEIFVKQKTNQSGKTLYKIKNNPHY